jgi:protein involved in polysaccharide export with SLBB domain
MQFSAKKYNTVSFKSPDNNLITVSITGAIDYPGTYVLNDTATIEDLYQLIGNFKNQAYLRGIALSRESIRERQVKAIKKSKEDLNTALLNSNLKGDAVGDVDIIRALSESIDPENLGRLAGDFSPKSQASLNTVLLDNDRIVVPKNPNAISVFGEVLNPIAMEYKKNLSLNSAINNAGGYQQYADKRRVYVIKANGIVEKASRNIFVRDVKLEPGDTIVIPRKIITQNPGIQALAPITQILSDLAFSAAAIDNLQSN